jgi:hypothetical protein
VNIATSAKLTSSLVRMRSEARMRFSCVWSFFKALRSYRLPAER